MQEAGNATSVGAAFVALRSWEDCGFVTYNVLVLRYTCASYDCNAQTQRARGATCIYPMT